MTLDEIQDKVVTNEYDYTFHAEIERKADSLTFHQIESAILGGEILDHDHYNDDGRGVITMENKKCNFCGSTNYEKRRTDYLYSYRGNYLLVPNTPVEVCLNCGMIYFDAKVLKEIEKRFFAIQRKSEKPDGYVELPVAAYAESIGHGA